MIVTRWLQQASRDDSGSSPDPLEAASSKYLISTYTKNIAVKGHINTSKFKNVT
jgi:hypothetical protein